MAFISKGKKSQPVYAISHMMFLKLFNIYMTLFNYRVGIIFNFYIVIIEMHSSVIIVHRECGELAETEVCIVHVYQIEELHESEWKNL